MDLVWSQAYHLLTRTNFDYNLTAEEIKENDWNNKRYQVATPERDLLIKFFQPGDDKTGDFKTATDMLEYISARTAINLSPVKVGKELRFLGFERKSKRIHESLSVYGYYVNTLKD